MRLVEVDSMNRRVRNGFDARQLLLWVGFFFLLVIVPVYAFEKAPRYPEAQVIEIHRVEARETGPSHEGSLLEHVAALSAFYQTLITIMTVLFGVVSVIAFFTVRQLSTSAAEEMALSAAMRVLTDSRKLRDEIDYAVDEAASRSFEKIEGLEKKIALISKLVSELKAQDDASEDGFVYGDYGGGPAQDGE